MTVKQEKK